MKLRTLASRRLIFRAWYYFRQGYSTYLTFILGYASTLVTVYYLAIKNIPDLLSIFPRFVPFAALATGIGAPLAVFVGWLHFKKSGIYTSEQDISIETSPYYYKIPPGYTTEVSMPGFLLTMRILGRLAENSNLLTDSEKAEIAELEKKVGVLLKGGYVGHPKGKINV
jgi:hypothetical protein